MRHSYLFIIAIMLAVMTPRIAPAQSIAVKSNVLYDLTGTLNLGGEIRCDDTHSFNLSVNYNPWNQFRWNHSFHHGQEQPLSG